MMPNARQRTRPSRSGRNPTPSWAGSLSLGRWPLDHVHHKPKQLMAKEKTCLRCGGTNLEPGIIQSTGRIHFRATNTKIMTFQTSDVKIDANICMDCGTLDLVGDFKKAHSLTGRAKPA